jgi:hypothetical protein
MIERKAQREWHADHLEQPHTVGSIYPDCSLSCMSVNRLIHLSVIIIKDYAALRRNALYRCDKI